MRIQLVETSHLWTGTFTDVHQLAIWHAPDAGFDTMRAWFHPAKCLFPALHWGNHLLMWKAVDICPSNASLLIETDSKLAIDLEAVQFQF